MDNIILRLMAWERAKGELKSMIQTFVGEEDKHKILKKTINDFINDIEGNGKHE